MKRHLINIFLILLTLVFVNISAGILAWAVNVPYNQALLDVVVAWVATIYVDYKPRREEPEVLTEDDTDEDPEHHTSN